MIFFAEYPCQNLTFLACCLISLAALPANLQVFPPGNGGYIPPESPLGMHVKHTRHTLGTSFCAFFMHVVLFVITVHGKHLIVSSEHASLLDISMMRLITSSICIIYLQRLGLDCVRQIRSLELTTLDEQWASNFILFENPFGLIHRTGVEG